MALSVFDKILQLAQTKGANIKQQQENEKLGLELPYVADKARLANLLTQGEIDQIPSAIRARLAQAGLQEAETAFIPTKYNLEGRRVDIEDRKNSPEMLQAQMDNLNSLTRYRNTPGAMNRGLSPVSKLLNEADAADMEGDSARANELRAAAQKIANDSKTRRTALEFTNVVKNLDEIDIPSIASYAGPQGWVKLQYDKSKALSGHASPQYEEYYKFVKVRLPAIAEDIRRSLGTSITPEMQYYIQRMTDPIVADANPVLAIQQFEALKHFIKTQAGTYLNAIDKPIDTQGTLQSMGEGMGGQPQPSAPGGKASALAAELARRRGQNGQ